MGRKAGHLKKTEERIQENVREMVDLRLKGDSFQLIAEHFETSKWTLYQDYRIAAESDFLGYDPVGKEELIKALRGEETFSEIAFRFNLSVNGLKNYMTDRGISERRLPVPSQFDEKTCETDDPVLKKFLADKTLTSDFMKHYGISYYAGQAWADAAGLEIEKIAPSQKTWTSKTNLPEKKDFEGKEITVKALVDLRCSGLSFGDIGNLYGVDRTGIFKTYAKMQERNFDGYDPFDREAIQMALREKDVVFEEIARSFMIPVKGLRNYIADRNLEGRPYPTYEEICSGSEETRIRVGREYLQGKRNLRQANLYYGTSIITARKWAEKLREKCPVLESESGK